MARFQFVVRFKLPKNGRGDENVTKAYRTTAKTSKDAARQMKSKGRVVSVRKVKRIMR